jgi:pimeloyl-ACP methyl ester carboxylesterase
MHDRNILAEIALRDLREGVLGLRATGLANDEIMKQCRLITTLSLLLGACGGVDDRAAGRNLGALQFEPCTLSATGLPATIAAQCGTLSVPEDRANPSGRTIALAIAFVPSNAKRPQADPVLLLAGGPGQSARESFPAAAGAFRELLRTRDVVLVDQRGTGASNPLACRTPDGGEPSARAVAAGVEAARRLAGDCLRSLDADPRFYTTSDAVLDLEAVRAAIGAEQVNLVGVSYGTRVALEYLRRHPARVRSLVLDGVVPPELALGAEHARNLEVSLDAQFARCAADVVCAQRFGSPRAALAALLEALDQQPQPVHYRDPLTHELREDTLTRDVVAGVVRLFAYVPQLAAMLPQSLAEAAAGRPEVLMAQGRMIENLVGEQIMQGMQLSVNCSEDAERLRIDPGDARTLMGTAFVATLLAQCEAWPRGRRPADFDAPVRSDRPALLLSGEFDPVTPPHYGEQVVRHLANGRHLVARGQGHNVMVAGCAPQLVARFVSAADAGGLDATCLERLTYTPPFAGAYGWEP